MTQIKKSGAFALIGCVAVTVLASTYAFHVSQNNKTAGQHDAMVSDESKPINHASFAELGVFLEPKMISNHDGNMVPSFLHTSPMSIGAAYDSVRLPKKDKLFQVTGSVGGLVQGNPVTVILGTMFGSRFDILYESKISVESPIFNFMVVKGRYYIKIEASGYYLPGASRLQRPCKRDPCPFTTTQHQLQVEPIMNNDGVYRYQWVLQESAQYGIESLTMIDPKEASAINADTPGIEGLLDYSDAAAKLKMYFGIELHGAWGSEYASRVYTILDKWDWYKDLHKREPKQQKWVLTDEPLYPQDVSITRFTPHNENPPDGNMDAMKYTQMVTFSRQAFTYAVKRALEKGKGNGIYFSRRLHKSIIRALCLHEPKIMRELFTHMHDVILVEPTQRELFFYHGMPVSPYPESHYQSWFKHPEELVEMATSWREFPAGLQKISGLKFLFRRVDGMVNPESPTAPAIAYPRGPGSPSYIEFMESGFYKYPDVPLMVLHEIAHFVHQNVVTPEMFQKWRDVGGWFRDTRDPDGWITRQQTEFVSDYGHKKNPEEDFATCLTDYVLRPNLLRSRAPRKYDFMRNNVMNGAYYVTKATHEFLVLNLGNPDFMYPGRITNVDITVTGKVDQDKQVKFIITLANNGPQSCAVSGKFRLVSSVGTFHDVELGGRGCTHTLEGSVLINKTQKRGVWTTDQIVLVDEHQLHRYVGSADFGMRVWIDNVAEDFIEPKAITTSIGLHLLNTKDGGGIARATWIVADAGVLREKSCGFASVYSITSQQYSLGSYAYGLNTTAGPNPDWRKGIWNGCRQVPSRMCDSRWVQSHEIDGSLNFNKFAFDDELHFEGLSANETNANVCNCFQVAVNIPLSKAARSGKYFLSNVSSFDSAGNSQMLQWPREKGPFIEYNSGRAIEDNSKPELRNVRVDSAPVDVQHPNGETVVNIDFDVRDPQSGIAGIIALLRDPFGAEYQFQPDFNKNENNWQRVSYRYMLPRGSVPGVWHLAYIVIYDNAGNNLTADLNEQVLVQAAR
ncbi:uncharacterized protein BBOV_IV000290 [Babesia bovis T2Bo]|uniref:Conserved membrane protein n=1 Tax=Babesia bovis TaxID=5865 RepID=A7AV03_BABBO|nr:uncharacterized protein BBOV_IV000290 [Babesia bovis T2Bo]EDO05629.1 putative integral membrane protein [Babesia bovis T2Bo]|eukprot:XP_001609197.1 hypothetical protein [Babesia bovis T2Bo]